MLSPYQVKILRCVWESGEATSRDAHLYLHEHGPLMSRATVINFLNRMVEEAVLGYRERPGKGGFHKVYYPRTGFQNEAEFRKQMALRTLAKVASELRAE